MATGAAIFASAIIQKFSADQQASALSRAAYKQTVAQEKALTRQLEQEQQNLAFQQEQIAKQDEFIRQNREDLMASVESGELDINQAYDLAVESVKSGTARGISSLQPFAGTEELNIAQSYLRDPSQVSKLPGYEQQKKEGYRSLDRMTSQTTGGGLSGAGIKAAQKFGQDYASSALDTALNRLMPFINTSFAARQGITNLETSQSANLASLATGRGSALATQRRNAVPQIMPSMNARATDPNIAESMANIGNIESQLEVMRGMISAKANQGLIDASLRGAASAWDLSEGRGTAQERVGYDSYYDSNKIGGDTPAKKIGYDSYWEGGGN